MTTVSFAASNLAFRLEIYCIFVTLSQEENDHLKAGGKYLIRSLALQPICFKSKSRFKPSSERSQALESFPISSGNDLKSGLWLTSKHVMFIRNPISGGIWKRMT